MANENLNNSIELRGGRIESVSFPPGSPMPFVEALVNRGDDVEAVASKAQDAASGAYDAQIRNDEQDIILNRHELRIGDLEVSVSNHEIRITSNTDAISLLDVRVTTAENDILILQGSVSGIQGDYVSKSATTDQVVQSGGGGLIIGSVAIPSADKLQIGGSANASVSYKVSGIKVVGERVNGWTASTGTQYKGAFNADATFAVDSVYVQAQMQSISFTLTQTRQRMKALEDALFSHGLIGA